MSILVIAEHDNSNLKPATLNTIAAGSEISPSVHLLVAGNSCQSVADECSAVEGVEKVLLADDVAYENQLAESIANLIKSASSDYTHILAPATTFGKNILPRLSALLDVQQISEIIEIISEDTFKRPIYAGSCIATVKSNDPIKVITVRATAFDPVNTSGGSATVDSISAEGLSDLSSFVGEEIAKTDRPELTAASIVISGGRGMQSGDNFHLLETIADKLGAAV
ncbi:MAG: FAD-binding protein, partial [Pseudomonadota bacterium]|nr:FAD-binding protein [Pseudomonadota bacterium]